jgi:hypothetical protein
MFPTARVVAWDSSIKSRSAGDDDLSSLSSMKDVNDLLDVAPEQHTFIILKNMFYAAKTMVDNYVGVLYDRPGNKDDTNLQSLLGRACGYNKSQHTVIITSKQTVTNYLACWRDMCARRNFQIETQDVSAKKMAKKMDKKMPFVRATESETGTVVMTQTTAHATPVSNGGVSDAAAPARKKRETANEDNFTSEWREFSTFKEAEAWASKIEEKKMDAEGFYLSSTTGKTKRVTYNEVMGLKSGKKTANLPWNKLKVNKSSNRLYVAYRDTSDPSSAVFVVRRLTRVQ